MKTGTALQIFANAESSLVFVEFLAISYWHHLLIYFPLLKSREKLQQQDKIWLKICGTLMWEYIPSI